MTHDNIVEVEIDKAGLLRVRPKFATFPYIYREAMEVSWHQQDKALCSPNPRDWAYLRWFEQILAAASEQGYRLLLTPDTKWVNVATEIRTDFMNAMQSKSR